MPPAPPPAKGPGNQDRRRVRRPLVRGRSAAAAAPRTVRKNRLVGCGGHVGPAATHSAGGSLRCFGLAAVDAAVAVGVEAREEFGGAEELAAAHVPVAVAVHLLKPPRAAGTRLARA